MKRSIRASIAPATPPPSIRQVAPVGVPGCHPHLRDAGLHEDRHDRVSRELRSGRSCNCWAARGLPLHARFFFYAWHPLPLWEFAGSGHVGRHGDRIPAAGLRGGRSAFPDPWPASGSAGGGSGQIFPGRGRTGDLTKRWDWRLPAAFGGLGLRCFICPIWAPGPRSSAFSAGYVAEEGLEAGLGHISVAAGRQPSCTCRSTPSLSTFRSPPS